MSGFETRFDVELRLSNGRTISYYLKQYEVEAIVARPEWRWPEGLSEDDRPFAAVYSDLAARLRDSAGFVHAIDHEAGTWSVRADAVVAFKLRDVKQPRRTPPLQFVPLELRSLANR